MCKSINAQNVVSALRDIPSTYYRKTKGCNNATQPGRKRQIMNGNPNFLNNQEPLGTVLYSFF